MKTADAGVSFLHHHLELCNRIVDFDTQMKGGAILGALLAKSLWWGRLFSCGIEGQPSGLSVVGKFIEENFTYELM